MSSLLLLKSMLYANALQKSKKKKSRMKKTYKPPKRETINLINMCRICNNEKGDIPIFNNFNQPNIPEEIQNFSGIVLNNADNLSKHMCQSCLDLLNGCIMFREMCQRNNKHLIEVTIKQEFIQDNANLEENNDPKADSEDSYNVPSPTFSTDNSELLSLWRCSKCAEEFYVMSDYTNHISKCNARPSQEAKPPEEVTKKKFLCDICGKTALSNASLLIHKATHENVFPYKCDICPYQGRTMDLLKVHKRSHLADKPFKCTQCPKATTTSSNLAKHMRHVHSNTRPFKCSYCDKAFSYQHDMKRHVKDIHLRQGTVECLPEDISYSIAIDKNEKKVYFGTGKGIFEYNYENHYATPVTSSSFKLDMIFVDKYSNKYVTENNDGVEELYLLDDEMMKRIRFSSLEALNELTIDDDNNFYYIKDGKLYVLKSSLSSPLCIGNVSYDGMAQIAVHNNNVFVASDDLLYFHENDTGDIKVVDNAPDNVTAIAFDNAGDFILGVRGKLLKYKKHECYIRKPQ
uniref:SFRICE_006601 n=1 Tax=Spodoptera frugiperda TaxID=7108 RepID=A0A2H1VBV7_SPOFR